MCLVKTIITLKHVDNNIIKYLKVIHDVRSHPLMKLTKSKCKIHYLNF